MGLLCLLLWPVWFFRLLILVSVGFLGLGWWGCWASEKMEIFQPFSLLEVSHILLPLTEDTPEVTCHPIPVLEDFTKEQDCNRFSRHSFHFFACHLLFLFLWTINSWGQNLLSPPLWTGWFRQDCRETRDICFFKKCLSEIDRWLQAHDHATPNAFSLCSYEPPILP